MGLVGSPLAADDGFGSGLGLSLARFGCSRGPFKGCFGIRQAVCDHQNCLSELRNLMVLVPDVVVAVVLVVVLVVIFVAALFFCHFSSTRPGGIGEAIESDHRALGARVGAVWWGNRPSCKLGNPTSNQRS